MDYEARSAWEEHFERQRRPYPSEGLIRILRGSYPGLPELPVTGKAVDVGCGEGRNAQFLHDEGFAVTGVEISDEIIERNTLEYPKVGFVRGFADSLPFEDASFRILVSWNSLYYVGLRGVGVDQHLAEFSRILEPGGWFIFSVPQPTSFIFQGSRKVAGWPVSDDLSYQQITEDPFHVRNGEVLACWRDKDSLKRSINEYFRGETALANTSAEWFGLQYDWFVGVAQKS